MRPKYALFVVLLLAATMARGAAGAARKLTVALPPFDIATVDSVDQSAGDVLAKLVRVEMTSNGHLQPVLLQGPPLFGETPAAGATPDGSFGSGAAAVPPVPVPPGTDVVLRGTILAAETSENSNQGNTSSLFGGALNVSGTLARSSASVALHIELLNPQTGDVVESFDVKSKGRQVGLGSDIQSAIGAFNVGDSSFDKSAIGKALRDAAHQVATEVAKRADKLARR